ncbi:bifunctional 4-hydroxy-2-oxoglutarate aldolase/2-dehydro-3-deoxy-phosphogluconate aldolase [Proteus sp. DFP240708]|uniref:bifunctional 4-hydroxy-2-oxoglutarate aldolase/2-dehydro-3-deoxy-phosphogluconate aldolase n=1 Tax=Proteus TaxID=583 RepID=UPI00159B2B54|nr:MULTISPECIES: bifunctional 4-hydroxy-2-oxoglutarate aldolase/2-dehydro-3-deoxy-phosphogluconate aldolase [Proteus]MBI6218009.1 bifunctional 4-hydroxy-2-oxoglutarate aldolase/2-dehydro-3-deoxy-phosphogluconate aldolase [Proteus vulgaris]MBI6338173.1 bifunctional 4-hydroxy-2-oxoglutarate aldolase/2-dehydro-3-deoxy-phosphogluconate aldolase [Proteus sp. PR00224]MBI6406490.1 bifunctional 4-hydroxy-2-oxoglutarate aldolase/2-dehydro-3-deoxy-phosphogluconate aldolase [Proteus sp. PR00208]MBI6544876
MTQSIVDTLSSLKVIPVIQINRAEDAIWLGEILTQNQLPVAEITFRTPAAAKAIKLMHEHFPELILCAGTVLTAQQADMAKEAGASFVISPGYNPSTVDYCLNNGIDIVPGINNPSQVEVALEKGLTLLKFFPAEASGGVKMLKALASPYAQVQFMPTGGISLNNVSDYLAIPQVVACGGSWIATADTIDKQDKETIVNHIQSIHSLLKTHKG